MLLSERKEELMKQHKISVCVSATFLLEETEDLEITC